MRRVFTELTIKSLPYSDGPQIDVWDANLPRFGLRIGKQTKTFILNAGKRRIVLGRYGVISLKDARDEAKRRIGAKYLPNASPLATEVAKWYLAAIQDQKSPGTINAYSIYLRRLPHKQLHELNVQNLYAALPQGKGAANLCFSTFKAFLSWCVERGHLETNFLLRRRQPNKLQSRDRLLSSQEIATIWHAPDHPVRTLFRALILSGQRISQLQNFDPAWIQDAIIVFPRSVMKNGIEFALPLTTALRATLPQPTTKSEINTFKSKIPIPDFRPHDFRRYLSSTCAMLRIRQEVVERGILAHTTGSISQIAAVYNRHRYEQETREALERYSEHLFQNVLAETNHS